MRITSSDFKSWISIEQHGDEQYSSFKVKAFVDIEHGSFSGENTDVQFLNIKVFIIELDEFILNRTLHPKLEGTYNSFIEFYKATNNNAILVNFSIGDAYSGYSEIASYSIKGTFEIDPEYINIILQDFIKLEKRCCF